MRSNKYRAERRKEAKALAKAQNKPLREVWPEFRLDGQNAAQAAARRFKKGGAK